MSRCRDSVYIKGMSFFARNSIKWFIDDSITKAPNMAGFLKTKAEQFYKNFPDYKKPFSECNYMYVDFDFDKRMFYCEACNDENTRYYVGRKVK